MLTQKLPNEAIDNDLVDTSLDSIILKINVPEGWSRVWRFSARYTGYDTSYVESINENALLVDSDSTPTNKIVFTYASSSHAIKFTPGEHYIKIFKMSGYNGISLEEFRLPMHVVFGNPKYIYRTCSSRIGIGNIIVDGLPFDAAKYKLVDQGTNIGSTGSFYMYGCKCSDLSKVISQFTVETHPAWFIGLGSDITGDISCMNGRSGLRFYAANTKIYGDIKYLGSMVDISGSTTGDPAIYIANSGIYGDLEEFAQSLFDNGKHSGTIMCQLAGTQVTYDGEVINGNATVEFTDEDFTITIL